MNERSIFIGALEKDDPAERAAWLADACGADKQLRDRIQLLLLAHQQAAGILDRPIAEVQPTTDRPVPDDKVAAVKSAAEQLKDTTIAGRYKLLEEIAEGGMGSVWVAQQTEPVRRRVALKLIKPGMDSRQVLSRFEAERQALALMDHPNIAKVLDGGVTNEGRPFFVMEYVKGVPITEFCDQARLSVQERLQLFVQVCQAVQHAHQKGIIHRDLKPSNILVCLYDGKPVPKVIDFGLAKAMHQPLTEHSLYTAHGMIVGTPLYMSPEQVEFNNLDIDTRTDVYSLGVILYELLTGSTPLERGRFKEAAWQEIVRLIKEEEPTKPSTKLSGSGSLPTIAAQRNLEPAQLSRLMRGDLDWIVMKSLEKERSRRYETANGLARDIERYLHDDPVEARPPSAGYRFSKFARRNKAAFATTGLVAAVLVVGTIISTWQAIRATRAEHLAEAAHEQEIKQRQIAESERVAAEQARAAEAQQRKAVEVEREVAIAQRAEADSQRREAERQKAAAEANYEKARQAVDEYFTLVSESKLFDVPGLQPLRKELLEAARRFYESSALERTDDPDVLADLAATYARLAVINSMIDRNDDTVTAARKALDVIDRLRKDFPEARSSLRRLAGFWKGFRPTQRSTELPKNTLVAVVTITRMIKTWEELVASFPDEVKFRSDLGALYFLSGGLLASNGQHPGGIRYFSKGVETLAQLAKDAPDHREYRADLARCREQLARSLSYTGRGQEAQVESRAALDLREQLVAEEPESPQFRQDLGSSLHQYIPYAQQQDPAVAERLMQRLIEVAESLVRDYPNVALYRWELLTSQKICAVTRVASGDPAAIDKALSDYDQMAANSPSDAMSRDLVAHAARHIADALPSTPETRPKAIELHRRSLEQFQELVRDFPNNPNYREDIGHSGRLLGWRTLATDDSEGARKYFEIAVKAFEELMAADIDQRGGFYQEYLTDTIEQVAGIWAKQGNSTEAVRTWERCIRLREELVDKYPTNREYRWKFAELLAATARQIDAVKAREKLSLLSDRFEQDIADEKDPNSLDTSAWSIVTWRDIDRMLADIAVKAALRAHELAPRSASCVNSLGVAQYRAGDYAAAIQSLNRSRMLDEGMQGLPAIDGYFLAMAHSKMGQAEQAEKWFRAADLSSALLLRPQVDFRQEAVETLGIEVEPLEDIALTPEREQEFARLWLAADPSGGWIHQWLGSRLADRGEWIESEKELRQAAEGLPENPVTHYRLALAQLALGEQAAYRATCARMLDHSRTDSDSLSQFYLTWTCSIGPDAVADWTLPLRVAQARVDNEQRDADALRALGVLKYRAGSYQDGLDLMLEAESSEVKPAGWEPLYGQLFLAMAHHRLGHTLQAREQLAGVQSEMDKPSHADKSWNRRATLEVLRREAQQLILGAGVTAEDVAPVTAGDIAPAVASP